MYKFVRTKSHTGSKFSKIFLEQLYTGWIVVVVPRLNPNIQKNCAFCDTSTKFGTNVH